ncbi:MAG: hypothetical protein ABMA13_09810 [Chthoniobacteraceae bacterium]
MERQYTDFLVADGSYLTGAGTVFNLGGEYFLYNRSGSPAVADARALRQDFAMVGQDIRDVAVKAQAAQQKQQLLDL